MNIYNVVAEVYNYNNKSRGVHSFSDNMKLKKNPKQVEQTKLDEYVESEYIRSKILKITDKIHSGFELTATELEFLREESPGAYEVALEVKREREQYAKELENCKSKEEVKKLKLKKDLKY